MLFDGRRPDSVITTFPRTDGGLLDAKAAMRTLVRTDRLSALRIVLIWGTVVGLMAWMVSSIVVGFIEVRDVASFGGPGSLITATLFVVTISRAVWVGSLAGLVLMWLVRSGDGSDMSEED